MQIVINLLEKDYKSLNRYITFNFENEDGRILSAVKHGVVLPKNHGRLIDADAFAKKYETCINDKCNGDYVHAPTILEATEDK